MGMHGSGWWSYIRSNTDEKRPSVSMALIRRVLTYARPYRREIVGMLVMILITTGLGLLNPLIFRDLIDNVLLEGGPNYGDMSRLNVLALALILIPVVRGVISVVQRKYNATVGEGTIYDLRVALYSHLQRMSLRFFTNTKTGELMSRLNNDVVDAQRAISDTIVSIVTNFITVVATLAVMLTLEWRLTILGVVVLPLFILVARRVGNLLREIIRTQMQHNARMNAMMNETLNISGALLVKLFGQADTETSRFQERAKSVRDTGIDRAVLSSQFFMLISLVSVIGTAVVYWVGGHLVLEGAFTVGTIVAFGSYLTQLYGPLQSLTNAPVDFATSIVSFERVFEIVDLPLEIDEKPDAVHIGHTEGNLVFDDVTFAYDNSSSSLSEAKRFWEADDEGIHSGTVANQNNNSQAREIALKDVSFKIKSGQLVALVGPSGAGKTTLTYLIPRLYDPTAGRILLDGHDLRDLTLSTLSDNIGMVTQETYLFHDTVLANLLYAKPDATQEELEAACMAANIHDFIAGLSNGYDTLVGERGYRLSGGEKQRIAIARVILKNPRILVLDEATSHLDSQSEALVQDALARVQEGRTSIVIAHRLSTILAADHILVMNRGEIVEQGTHAELIAHEGLYSQLYETQFRAVENAIAEEPLAGD
ncbi:MAG: ABC transporter ATP-binding protein [Anaerolineae bacterium]|nr:ABC transporter ATP-binding protein [Anaerolineae bacterium]MCA9891691.1 ABC transporter ATP-binding protein [Anaerolineae bacterium]